MNGYIVIKDYQCCEGCEVETTIVATAVSIEEAETAVEADAEKVAGNVLTASLIGYRYSIVEDEAQ